MYILSAGCSASNIDYSDPSGDIILSLYKQS